jgi:hypothetical protein
MTYTNEQLKRTLAKMLPEQLQWNDRLAEPCRLFWKNTEGTARDTVLDTELLHLCWLVEETLGNWITYRDALISLMPNGAGIHVAHYHATWQQRTIALAQTLGIEIV